ncbi:MAG: DEAD/DEAH box helicase [Luteolibacter sp.]
MKITNVSTGGVAEIYRRLIIGDIRSQLGQTVSLSAPVPDEEQIGRLLSWAGMIALSSSATDRNLSYEIVSRVLEVIGYGNEAIVQAVSFVMTRLGNFPARALVNSRSNLNLSDDSLPSLLGIESLAHRHANTILINHEDSVVLTDFQSLLFSRIGDFRAVSFSAPTSAGKSFLLGLDLVRRLRRPGKKSVVFVVPTRALIRQVMRDVNQVLATHELEVPVVCIPELFEDDELDIGVVYVLTQERLLNLVQNSEGVPYVSTLIIDEAQEIQSGTRGMLLQSAIEKVIDTFPFVELVFSSPLRSNPGYLLEIFRQQREGSFFVEECSPVTQNLLLIKSVPRKPLLAAVSILSELGTIDIGEIPLEFSFRGSKQASIARFAVKFTRKGDSSIIYANGSRDAESIAEQVGNLLKIEEDKSERIEDLVNFITNEIHPLHPLIPLLRKRCAFHYGHLPHIIRSEIEDLVKSGEISFLISTSTLLQGVNLPAKNIFIWSPKKGNQSPMSKGDFWNLAGRAGRLTREFHGNVWCINVDEWEIDPFSGTKDVEISSALRNAYTDMTEHILAAANDRLRPAESKSTSDVDYAFSAGFSAYTLDGKLISTSPLANDENRELLVKLDSVNQDLAKEIDSLPFSVFQKNSGISPFLIAGLFRYFESFQDDIGSLLPQHPLSQGAYERIQRIFQVLEEVFFKTGKQSYKYYTWLAHQWLHGASLKQLIAMHISRQKIPSNPKEISIAIEELLKSIESVIRFRYVKYVRVYIDVLQAFLISRNEINLLAQISPLHSYLEYGAAKSTLINLMALGISRTSALEISAALELGADKSRRECYQIIRSRKLSDLNMSAICRRELGLLLSL